jgi:hypothetical protein
MHLCDTGKNPDELMTDKEKSSLRHGSKVNGLYP